MSELAGQVPGPSCIALSDEVLGCVVLVDGDGTIVDISPGAESLLGWSPDGIRGKAIDVLVPEPVRTQHARQVSEFLADSERPATRRLHPVALHLDGREIPVDIELRPLLFHGDRYVAAVLTDATTDRSARLLAEAHTRTAIGQELKSADGRFLKANPAFCQLLNYEALSELAESESRYRLLAENATDVVYQLDADSRLKWVSPSIGAVLGWRPEQLIGVDAIELAHPDDIATVLSWRRKLFDGTESPKFEVRMRCADGATKWMSLQARPTRDHAGSINGVIVGLRDVDQEVRARAQAARVEGMFRLAMNGAPQGMSVTGLDLGFLQVNPALCSMLGRDEAWLLAHNVRDVVHPADLEQDLAGRGELLNGRGEASVQECRWLRADGSEIWVNHSMGLLRDEHEQPLFYVSHVQDNTAAHQARAELSYRPTHDALTGLINREHVHERIAGVLGQVPLRGGPAGLLFCDLDNFKQVNDNFGHAVGDHVLRITADRIVSVLRGSDIVARLGGDEFVVMLTEVHDLSAAIAMAEKIREAVAAPIILDDQHLNITISVGVALAVPDADVALLLRSADGALYEAKEGGRDRVATFAGTQEGHRGHGYDEQP